MAYSKADILNRLKSEEYISKFKSEGINTVILFGSILTESFAEHSDIDIAILSQKEISLNTILNLEEYLERSLERDIDIINLRDKNMDLNMKVSIYDTGRIVYNGDNLYDMDYRETERLYKDNETFRFFRKRDVIF